MTDLLRYRYIHAGKDIYILGSGVSMDFMPLSFFSGKVTIGLNRMYNFMSCTYIFFKDIVTKEGFVAHHAKASAAGSILITPWQHEGFEIKFPDYNYIVAPVGDWGGFVDLSLLDTDTIINSHLSITTAIHIAYYMGAKNIILCGIDCGMIDGRVNMRGYYDNEEQERVLDNGFTLLEWQQKATSHPYNEFNITSLRDALKIRGCNLLSLCPFVNIGLEGHEYSKHEIPEEDMWAGPTDKIILT